MTSVTEVLIESRMETPIGLMIVLSDREGVLRALDWEDHEDRLHRLLRRQYPVPAVLRTGAMPDDIHKAMNRYFDGDLTAIDVLPVRTGGTAFQHRVWEGLRRIPAGETRSYGALADAIGHPVAVRAVGAANGANPIGIVVPCHRVIGANGSLTGYGGGLARKQWLLAHERRP